MFVNVDWFFRSHRIDIVRAAKRNGFDMTVFAEITNEPINSNDKDVDILSSPLTRRNKNLFSAFYQFCLTFALLSRTKPDIVHAVTIKPIIFTGVICKVLNISFVASISGLGPVFTMRGITASIRRQIVLTVYRIIFNRRNANVIFQNSEDFDYLKKLNIVKEDQVLITLGSGVELDVYKKQHNRRCKPPVKVLMASRLLHDKGVKDYCLAAKKIQSRGLSEARFLLAGKFDYNSPSAIPRDELMSLCKACGVEYVGDRKDLPELLSRCSIFVLPSYYAEGVPKVLLEAAASECAIVTTDHAGCRDAIVDGVSGLLVPAKNVPALANAISTLLRSPETINEMGHEGRKFAERAFSVQKVVSDHFKLYRGLIT